MGALSMVLFDLREKLVKMNAGSFTGDAFLQPLGEPSPTLFVADDGGVKTVQVTNRATREDGVAILISSLAKDIGLQVGDRITVTGRVAAGAPADHWGIILRRGSLDWKQLAQQIAPQGLFSLTYLLDEADLDTVIWVHTNHWGETPPTMDFCIDSILITRWRDRRAKTADTRARVYSLATDTAIQTLEEGTDITTTKSAFLQQSGNAAITVVKAAEGNALHVSNRVNDWDGLDIRLLSLEPGNKYRLKITGRIDGDAPRGMLIMLQGIPVYSWEGCQRIDENKTFALSHTFSQSELETWTAVRLATNRKGTTVPFFIDTIELGF